MYGADTYAVGDNADKREMTFKITSTKLYVSIVSLSNKDNVNLTKQLNEGFKRSVYWIEYKSKIDSKNADDNNLTRFYLDASFQEVIINCLFFPLITLVVLIEFEETVIENVFFQE